MLRWTVSVNDMEYLGISASSSRDICNDSRYHGLGAGRAEFVVHRQRTAFGNIRKPHMARCCATDQNRRIRTNGKSVRRKRDDGSAQNN